MAFNKKVKPNAIGDRLLTKGPVGYLELGIVVSGITKKINNNNNILNNK
ncbi:hypothetical protein [Tenuibacillus multivorans]|nr:hypothetical protein [Tenuibacillus multivorans]